MAVNNYKIAYYAVVGPYFFRVNKQIECDQQPSDDRRRQAMVKSETRKPDLRKMEECEGR
jgi:hypothetical protein